MFTVTRNNTLLDTYADRLTVVYLNMFDKKDNWIAASEKYGVGEKTCGAIMIEEGKKKV